MTSEFSRIYKNAVTVRLGSFAHFDALGAFILSLRAARRNSSTATLACAVFHHPKHIEGFEV
jgi:hypothetical protein